MYNEAKHLGTENDFFREMMLEVVNDDMRVFKREWIKRYRWSELRKQKFELNFFTSMDLAVSKKQHSDYSVIITIGVNSSGHWFIVRVDRGRYTPSEVIDKLFSHVREFNPLEVRAEKAALQQVLDHFIEEKMLKEKTHFLYNPLENNSIQKKEYRILGLQPLFKNRMVYFPDDICYDEVAALEKEILGFTKQGSTVKNDDAIDCLANFLDPDFIFKPNDYKRDDNVVYGYNTSIKDPTIF
jgi:phage terminase large subunit-like protein